MEKAAHMALTTLCS
jgi:septal ring factor EnvC (AmiA/AmiB activator)